MPVPLLNRLYLMNCFFVSIVDGQQLAAHGLGALSRIRQANIVTAGANPVFADINLNSQNISAETIKAALKPNTKAIIVVHLASMPAEMDDIMDLAKEHDLWVIEDCAQAHGAKYKGKSVGSIGHVGAWSFCQDKIMTTGSEGGMVTTNDKELWSKM